MTEAIDNPALRGAIRLLPRVHRAPALLVPFVATLLLLGVAGCGKGTSGEAGPAGTVRPAALRVGTMPNLTHAPALVGKATGRLAAAVAPTPVEWRFFNSGPSMIEALFAGELDILYIGPSPAVNGFVRSKGEAIRVVGGVTNGGAALVARPGSGWNLPADLAGRRIATPGFGNTQDISVRWWARQQGMKTLEAGGAVQVMPMTNPDMIDLMRSGQIDGAWTVEPWVSRLVAETGAVVLMDEAGLWPDSLYATTVMACDPKFARRYPALLAAWRREQAAVIDYVNAEPDSGRAIVNRVLAEYNHVALPEALIRSAWSRLRFDARLPEAAVLVGADRARQLGFLDADPRQAANGEGLFSIPGSNPELDPQ